MRCATFRLLFALVALVALVALAGGARALAADRVALVVGCNAYQQVSKLKNPVNDAKQIGRMLSELGFKVQQSFDPKIDDLTRAADEFRTSAEGSKVALFYYSGHGVEVDGENYVLPIDSRLAEPSQLRTQAISVTSILSDLGSVNCTARIIILDCCRDNPFAERKWMLKRSIRGGLKEIGERKIPPATMVMFAAGPGETALDGRGENSPFTTAMLTTFRNPKLTAWDAFTTVSDTVSQTTGDHQTPWVKFDGAGRAFRLFSLATSAAPPAAAPLPVAAAVSPSSAARPTQSAPGGFSYKGTLHFQNRKDRKSGDYPSVREYRFNADLTGGTLMSVEGDGSRTTVAFKIVSHTDLSREVRFAWETSEVERTELKQWIPESGYFSAKKSDGDLGVAPTIEVSSIYRQGKIELTASSTFERAAVPGDQR